VPGPNAFVIRKVSSRIQNRATVSVGSVLK
jgi:hypothetical protein